MVEVELVKDGKVGTIDVCMVKDGKAKVGWAR